MCGIVGLFLKDRKLDSQLGGLLSDMLVTMSDRGPDSAGIAIYGKPTRGQIKVTVQSPLPEQDLRMLASDLETAGLKSSVEVKNTHAVIDTTADLAAVRVFLASRYPQVRIMSAGESIEIYKEVGLPKSVVDRFGIRKVSGTHGIGHTRMATESAVTTLGAHPFSTGPDQCLVHNGSLSNHNNMRRELVREGIVFETENDTEVAAAYLIPCACRTAGH